MRLLKKYIKTFFILVLIVSVFRFTGSMEVSAASNRSKIGSITVELNDLGTDRTGVVFRLYDLSKLDPSVDVSVLSKLSSKEIKQLSKKLEEKAKQEQAVFLEQMTNKNGRAVFSDITEGIYLISQHAQADYGTVDPFLALVPYSEDGKIFKYDVVAKPKGESNPSEPIKPSKPSQPTTPAAKTGDESAISFYVALTFFGGIAIVALLIYKKRKK